ncbi:MAG TPA: class I SAM-dependent methyltransferase [Candidatus Limnocylindria bacterium]|nr:class I SAM-dependent methyltransferase [Candidatus Limnocylindria bacterium]
MSDPPTSVAARVTPKLAFGTGGSVVVTACQACASTDLEPVLFVGFLPPVNTMPPIGTRPAEQPAYPAQVLRCPRCELVQLGLVVDPKILFPPEYPYTSATTKILRENFAELYREVRALVGLKGPDLVVDIGSNDGTLLRNFQNGGHRVRGVEPTDQGRRADEAGIPTDVAFFGLNAARRIAARDGRAAIITAANVFAHIEDVHAIIEAVAELLDDDGVFITESHYWLSLVETLQYDTIYHEHLRYYSLTSLKSLLAMHGFDTFHAKRIPTHGGSIRVYAARNGQRIPQQSVRDLLALEASTLTPARLAAFRSKVTESKLGLLGLLRDIRARGERVYGVGAPSRSSTLINYVGLDEGIIDCVGEIAGSHKIGKYIPGTLIPVVDEERLFADQPEHALLFSWHIADELMPKLTARGFRGRFIVPLPEPRIIG